MTSPILVCEGIGKSFPGVQALRDVHVALFPNRILGLVGENGAGKSTLLRILSGVERPNSGRLLWEAVPISLESTQAALSRGIATVHQDVNLIGSLSVAENIFLNNEPARQGVISRRRLHEAAQSLLDRHEIPADPHALVQDLPSDVRKMVQILKALTWSPRVLLLDEPTSSLTRNEVEVVLRLIRSLASSGVSIVFVSHYLSEVFEVSDDIAVLRDGAVVLAADCRATDLNQVVDAMLGRAVARNQGRPSRKAPGDILLSVKDLSAKGVRGFSLDLRRGEIVGVTGLTGSGAAELARALFGVGSPKGLVEIEGRPVSIGSPSDAVRLGLGFVSSDRRGEGMLPAAAVYENIALPGLDRISNRLGLVRTRDLVAAGERGIERLAIRTPSPSTAIGLLSGGNQQKAMFAKWLEMSLRILILDEPTLGVDVGSKDEIRKIVERLCEEGMGVLLVTTELMDIELLCDRVFVMFRGEVVKELAGDDIRADAILRAATGEEILH